ncbi:MAG: hypothetical protein ABSC71_18795 [Candidatus Acidiferrales bacterium]
MKAPARDPALAPGLFSCQRPVPADVAELVQHEVDHLDGILMTARAWGADVVRPIRERDALVGEARARRTNG